MMLFASLAPAPMHQVDHPAAAVQEGLLRIGRALLVDWLQGHRQAIMGAPGITGAGLAVQAPQFAPPVPPDDQVER